LVAISKEILVLNEEFLLISNFAAFVFIAWIAGGDTINDMVKEEAETERKQNQALSDAYIESLQYIIKAFENSLALTPILNNFKSEFSSLAQQVRSAQEKRSIIAMRTATLSKLNSALQQEQAAKAQATIDLYDNATNYVFNKLKRMSPGLQDKFIDTAINSIRTGETGAEKDPVPTLYRKYFRALRDGIDPGEGEEEEEEEEEKQHT